MVAGDACRLGRRPPCVSNARTGNSSTLTVLHRDLPMAKSAQVPPHALRLTGYAELQAYVRAFAAGHLHLLLLFGAPGVGKSRAVRQALDPQVRWLSGQATPLGIYLEAFAYRHRPLVLDDIDGLYADRSGIRLLKALCQTEPVKTLG